MKVKQISCVVLVGLLATACGGGGSSRNTAPSLSGIADATVSANETSAPLAFTVSDRDVGGVTVTATSSDESVIPEGGIAVSGARGDLTLTVTPVPDTLGSSIITVTATDRGGLTDQTAFTVTVQAQRLGFTQYFRNTITAGPNEAPRDLNSRTFDDDAGNNDFADLLN